MKTSASWLTDEPTGLVAIVLLVALTGWTDGRAQAPDAAPANILFVIGDDMGVETLGSFGVGAPAEIPATVTLDELARRGVSFSNTWSQAMCSPTRATVLTGRYGFRTGVGGPTGDNGQRGSMPEPPAVPEGVVELRQGGGESPGPRAGGRRGPGGLLPGARWGLPLGELTLPRALETRSGTQYAKAAIGKWHLADTRNGWADHPNTVGFDHFSGLIRCCVESYFAWVKLIDGEFSTRTGYAVTDKVDDAIAWLDTQPSGAPWFLWLAFNAPHNPLHMPPADLLQSDYSDLATTGNLRRNGRRYFEAMIEAMDTEIGRLLGHIGEDTLENTYVVFLGDNGTGSNVVRAPFERGRAKGTLYNGGIWVPLIVAGPGVAQGTTSDALVNTTDLFATFLEMAGVDPEAAVPEDTTLDSVSLMPYLSDPGRASLRDWIYADAFTTELGIESGSFTMRDPRYKLLVDEGTDHFFDLVADPYEHRDLLEGALSEEQKSRYAALKARIAALHASER